MKQAINAYIEKLDSLLAKRLSAEKRGPILDEIRSHLLLATKEAMAQGEREGIATANALRDFGDLNEVAANLIKQHTGVNTKPAWQLVKVPILLFVLSAVLEIIAVHSHRLSFAFYTAVEICMAASLVTFGWAVAKSRRWLILPLATAVFASSLAALFAISWQEAGMPGSPTNSYGRQQTLEVTRDLVEGDEDRFAYARQAYENALANRPIKPGAIYKVNRYGEKAVALVPVAFQKTENAFLLWGYPVRTSLRTNYTLAPAQPNENPVIRWKANGSAAIQSIEEGITTANEWILNREKKGVLEIAWKRFQGPWLTSFLYSLIVLSFVNWVVLLMGKASDHLKRLRRRVA